MSKRVTLDLSSFQKLLEAAWVLQCEQDRVVNEVHAAFDEAHLRLAIPVVPCAPASLLPEEACRDAEALPLPNDCTSFSVTDIALPAPVLPAATSRVLGSLALAPDPQPVPQPASVPFPTSENPKKPVSRHGGIIGAIHARRALDLPGKREHSARPRLVLVIPKRTPSDLRAFVGPAVVLGVLLAFLFCEIAAHQMRITPVKAAPEATTGATDIPVPAAPHQHDAASATVASHLRVTDARTDSALQNLSPYEIRNLRQQAQFGDDSAALTLGMAYETGHGVRQNCNEAARWISIAATDGIAAAQYNLALRYQQGDGVTTDAQQAQKWMSAAAAQDYPQASVTFLQ